MPPVPPESTTPVQWLLKSIHFGGLAVTVARVQVELFLPTAATSPPTVSRWAWIDTAPPLSVVPFAVRQQGYLWQPLPGVQTTWNGVPCDVGHMDVWLSDQVTSSLRGPLKLLAKFPQHDPPG